MCLGFDFNKTFRVKQRTVPLDAPDIEAVASFAGSCHIHVMGAHFADYILLPNRIPAFPPIPGFPTAHRFDWLKAKLLGKDVLGNIGESVAAIVAQVVFDLQARDIAHLQVKGLKTPDYAMRFNNTILQHAQPHCPNPGVLPPEWWPVESKAADGGGERNRRIREEAFPQLASYWKEVPSSAGFGLICGFQHKTTTRQSPNILASLFLPKNQGNLQARLTTMVAKNIKKAHQDPVITGEIHGCR
jgi:hypothetical protein